MLVPTYAGRYKSSMRLTPDELSARIKAARMLRGLEQEDLARLLVEDGLGKHDLGRIERREIEMTRVQRDAICRHLKVPERWLDEPDVDVLVGLAIPNINPERLRDLFARLLAELAPGETPSAPESGSPPHRTDQPDPGPAGGSR
jgi:transcriptional regulator with XRE-family HTH domain